MTQETKMGRFVEYQRLAHLVSQEVSRFYRSVILLDGELRPTMPIWNEFYNI